MGTEEGRARFLAQAKPLVSQIEAPALGAMIRKRIAEMAGLDAGDLPGFLPAREASRTRAGPPARTIRRSPSAEAQILERVLRRLDLATTIDPDLLGDRSPEGRTLHAVLAFARESERGLTLGQVTAHFDGTEHAAPIEGALRESVLDQLDESDIDLGAELASLQERLALQFAERRKAELEGRSMAGGLTDAERAEWTELQARLAAAKGANEGLEPPSKR
jgi:DNA primase